MTFPGVICASDHGGQFRGRFQKYPISMEGIRFRQYPIQGGLHSSADNPNALKGGRVVISSFVSHFHTRIWVRLPRTPRRNRPVGLVLGIALVKFRGGRLRMESLEEATILLAESVFSVERSGGWGGFNPSWNYPCIRRALKKQASDGLPDRTP